MTSPRLSDWHPGMCHLTLGSYCVISIVEGPDDDVLEVAVDLPANSQGSPLWLVEDQPLPPIGEFTLVKAYRRGSDLPPIVTSLRAFPALAKPEPDAPPKPLADFLVESGLTFGQALALAPTPTPTPAPAPRPPLGLLPEHIHELKASQARMQDIAEALHRYAEAGVPSPPAWTVELLRRLK